MFKRSYIVMVSVLVLIMLAVTTTGCTSKKNSTTSKGTGTMKVTVTAQKTAVRTSISKSTAATTNFNTETGSDNDIPSTEQDNGNNEPVDNIETPVDENALVLEDGFSMEGRTIRMASYIDMSVNVNSAVPFTAFLSKCILDAQEKYNFKYEFILYPTSTFQTEIVNNNLAGLENYDMLYSQAHITFPILSKGKIITPLDDYIDFSKGLFSDLSPIAIFQGKHWGIPNMPYITTTGCVLYSRELFDKLALPDLQKVYDMNQWNWDNFLDISNKATLDTNGDGIIDMWGVQSDANIVMYFLLANGVRIYDSNESGKIITRINTPPAYRAMQYIQDLTFVYKTCIISGVTANSPFLQKKASILLAANGSTYNNQLKGKGLGSIGYVPMPLGPDTTERINATQTAANYLFMSSCRDLEKVIKVMSYTFIGWNPANPNFKTPEELAALVMRNWMPDESEKEIPYMMIAHTKSTLMPLPPQLNTIVATQILQPINAGVDRPATIIDRAMPAIQSTLDELFNR